MSELDELLAQLAKSEARADALYNALILTVRAMGGVVEPGLSDAFLIKNVPAAAAELLARTIRTSAEAMANPMEGDRWATGKHVTVISYCNRDHVWANDALDLQRVVKVPLAVFRKRCAGAEYLGNEK